MYEKYFDALGGAFGEFVDWLTDSQHRTDNSIVHCLFNRWEYLFLPELGFFDWSCMLEQYRKPHKCGDFPNEYKGNCIKTSDYSFQRLSYYVDIQKGEQGG